MRRLASELDAGVMSLYHHFPNKHAVLVGLIDHVLGEVEQPESIASDWRVRVRAVAIAVHESLLRHPWSAGLALALHAATPSRLRQMEMLLESLDVAGFPSDLADDAYHAIEGHIMGFTLWETGMRLGTQEDVAALATDFLKELPRRDYPNVVKHIEHHISAPARRYEGAFVFTLDLLLESLDRRRRP